jgi:hypothetical protein
MATGGITPKKIDEMIIIMNIFANINRTLNKIVHEVGLDELQKLKPIDYGDVSKIVLKIVQANIIHENIIDVTILRDIVCEYLLQKSGFDTTDIQYQFDATSQQSFVNIISDSFKELVRINTPIDGGNFVKSANKN